MMRRRVAALLVALLGAGTVACSAPSAAGPAPAPPNAPAGAAAASPAASAPAAAAPTAAAPAGAAQAPITVRVGSQQVAGNAGIYIAQDKGYFAEQGLDVQYVDVGLTTQMIPPLAAGQVEAVAVGLLGGTFNAIARGTGIHLVADSGQVSPDPANGFSSAFMFMAAKETIDSGRIRDFADLKGKTYGTTGTGGSTPELVLDRALRSAGLTLADIDTRTMTFADLPQAVANKSVDFALGVEPFIALGEARGIWVRWKSPTEIYPGAQIAALLYGTTMDAAGPDAGKRFAVAYTRGLRDYYEAFGPKAQNRAEIVSILVNNTAVKDPALYDHMSWNYVNPNCSVNLQTLANDLEWYAGKGYVPLLDVQQVVDDTYCQYAVQQLGAYPQ
ncbi:MAG TPA: ABC transporter substrate-binding protein [Chloroflexota bacterium]|nr:ABC transporter substrate-binding protein [Chloroflexota bacterium]